MRVCHKFGDTGSEMTSIDMIGKDLFLYSYECNVFEVLHNKGG